MTGNWSLKQTFLRGLIVALVASALLGIYAFLAGDFGETELKILLTTLSISYFSVTSLACAAAWEKRIGGLLAPIGLAAGILGYLFFIPGIWAEFWESEVIAKSMAILAIFAFSFAQACLLAMVPLKRTARWVFFATVVVILGLAAFVSGMIVFEADEEWLIRFAGVLGILDGCGSLVIPVLYKLGDRLPSAAAEISRIDGIELACPRCGHRGRYAIGTVTCEECSLRIKVAIGPT